MLLWSLLKFLIFVALVGALAFGAEQLISSSDYVRVVLLGTEYTLSPLSAVLALALLLVALWLVMKLAGLLVAVLRFINGDETALSRYFDRNRERRGFDALSEGMVALASGENRIAITKAQKAEKLLDKPELTTLLTAQAAVASGDKDRATEAYKRLLQSDQTRFVGVRGLMQQKLDEGDSATAQKLAEKAFALKPGHGETQDTLLRLQAADEDWVGANRTLTAKLKSGTLPRDVHKRRSAVVSLAAARDDLARGKTDAARIKALEANRLSPDLVPAAVLAARMHIDSENARAATKVIKAAWSVQPHPDLAAAFADIDPGETPQARVKRFGALLKLNADHPETRMLAAELHLTAEDFPAARVAMGDLAATKPTTRALSLMAAIERGEGAEDHVVRGWLTRALSVSRGPQWVCGACGTVHAGWAPVCENCASFDTLAWTEPRQTELAMVAGPEMLPLIVGTPAVSAAPVDKIPSVTDPLPEDDTERVADDVAEAEVIAPEAESPARN